MGDILLQQAMGLALLLVFGGLLAALAGVLPRLVNRWEGPPEPRGVGLAEPPPLPEGRQAAPQPSPRETAPTPAPEEDALLAAAVGLALALYHQEVQAPEAGAPAPGREASPWALAGRWQAMQRRLDAQQR